MSFLSSYTLTHPLTGCGYAAGQQAPRGIHLRPGNGNALYMNHAGWLQDHPAGWAGGVAEEYCQDAVQELKVEMKVRWFCTPYRLSNIVIGILYCEDGTRFVHDRAMVLQCQEIYKLPRIP